MKYWEYYEEGRYIVRTCERPDIVLDEIVQCRIIIIDSLIRRIN